jgi:hypothetical protein
MSAIRKLLLSGALCALLAALWLAPPDRAATRHVEDGLKRALVTYAAARALNAVISVAQGTEVALEPGGVGVVLAPGQALDPINDLVEQFSALMLLASVSFGVQRALLGIGGHAAVSAAVSLVALAWSVRRWRRCAGPPWLARLLLVLLLVRFAVPVMALGSDAVFQVFLAREYAGAQSAIGLSAVRLGAADAGMPPAAGAGSSAAQQLGRWWSQTPGPGEVGKRLDELKRLAADTADHVVTLIVVFLLQTLLLPLLTLWALLGLGRAALAPDHRER